MIINTAGDYTLQYTATDACSNTTTVERELVVEAPPYYGAVWDGGKNSQLTRTGLATNFSDPVPQMSDGNGGWTVGSSPFDDIMPWSGMQIVEDSDAGTLVSIPKFYFKWIRDELNTGSMELQISMQQLDGFHVSPAHADRGDGVGERDVVYVGRYHCAETTYKSTTGIIPQASVTKGAFRTSIHNLGSDIWQYDFAMYWTIAMLYLVEFANWNSQANIGLGCGNGSSKENNGITDAMTYHTGTNTSDREAYGHIQYRHIEGLWSNVFDWCDGVYVTSGDIYAIKDPSDFADSSNGTLVGTGSIYSDGVISEFTDPSVQDFEYALFPKNTSSNDYSKYVCDRSNGSSANSMMVVGGGYEKGRYYGMFCIRGYYINDSSRPSVGSRLMKLPSA